MGDTQSPAGAVSGISMFGYCHRVPSTLRSQRLVTDRWLAQTPVLGGQRPPQATCGNCRRHRRNPLMIRLFTDTKTEEP